MGAELDSWRRLAHQDAGDDDGDHRDALAGDDAQGIGSRSTAARIEHYCRGSFLKRAIPGAGEKQWEKEASLPPGLAGPR